MKSEHPKTGKVWLIGAGPGDPDLITCRGARILARADVVLHDALSHPELLELCQQAEIRNVGKRYGERSPDQSWITSQLVELAQSGKNVVRLKGGDPMLFARGAEEALALHELGIPFEIVPGISSPVAASEFAGISLTHREASSSVTFITGSDREGLEWSPEAWKKLATATGTICVLMGMRRIEAITEAILAGGRAPETPAAVVMWGARPEQRTVVGSLADIAQKTRAAQLSNPAIILIGEVVSLREQLNWYESKPLFGRKILIPRALRQARATVEAVRERAASPLTRPAIEITRAPDRGALERAVRDLSSYDWVIFTSANGVYATSEELTRLGLDARAFGSAKIAVIGPKTGAALRELGLRADLCAKEFVAEGLLSELEAQLGTARRALLLRAAEAREVLPDRLRERGIEVDVVAAYETRRVRGEAAARLRTTLIEEAEILLLTSSSMVTATVEALGEEARELLAEKIVACIGPITSATARSLGLRVDVEARVYTVEGALDALEEHLQELGPSV